MLQSGSRFGGCSGGLWPPLAATVAPSRRATWVARLLRALKWVARYSMRPFGAGLRPSVRFVRPTGPQSRPAHARPRGLVQSAHSVGALRLSPGPGVTGHTPGPGGGACIPHSVPLRGRAPGRGAWAGKGHPGPSLSPRPQKGQGQGQGPRTRKDT